jgi:hypothetical protein
MVPHLCKCVFNYIVIEHFAIAITYPFKLDSFEILKTKTFKIPELLCYIDYCVGVRVCVCVT